MILDSHTHAWARWPYDPEVPDEATKGSVEHLIHEMDQNGVAEAVIVSARIEKNPANNEYGAAAVRRYPTRLHQFADVDCSWSPEYHTPGAPVRLAHAAANLPIKGFTHYVGEPDGWFGTEEGRIFFRVADELKLIASIAMGPAWAPALAEVVAANPKLVVLLHHMGGISATAARSDLDAIAALAKYPNVHIKLSGFHYAVGLENGWDYPHPSAMWIAEGLYEAFGKRLCWGSDFPALSRALTYKQALEIVRLHCRFIKPGDLEPILGGTLKRLLNAAAPLRNP
ncbi:MAG: amidohydrolase family protein [Devosia sp.]|nr:amidohydrolase family protein [Devosia sp.]